MIDKYTNFFTQLEQSAVGNAWSSLREDITSIIKNINHGDVPKWQASIDTLPKITPSSIDLASDMIRIGTPDDATDDDRAQIKELLMNFHPWRKGPWNFFGMELDAEWRDDIKWNRIKDHIDLNGKTVLDIGANGGYFSWRMKGAGASLVLGLEPFLLSCMQFHAVNHYIQSNTVGIIPVRLEEMKQDLHCFDVVFSMGVLYHRKDPVEHLRQCRGMLAENGILVLETIVIDDADGDLLEPKDRYAKMRNVPYIPSVSTGAKWLKEAGFSNVDIVDVSTTTSEEQRVSEWMGFASLADFLDPDDSTKTVEGYPAPKRAVYIAHV